MILLNQFNISKNQKSFFIILLSTTIKMYCLFTYLTEIGSRARTTDNNNILQVSRENTSHTNHHCQLDDCDFPT